MSKINFGDLIRQNMIATSSMNEVEDEEDGLDWLPSNSFFRGTERPTAVDKGNWLTLLRQVDRSHLPIIDTCPQESSLESVFLANKRVSAEQLKNIRQVDRAPHSDRLVSRRNPALATKQIPPQSGAPTKVLLECSNLYRSHTAASVGGSAALSTRVKPVERPKHRISSIMALAVILVLGITASLSVSSNGASPSAVIDAVADFPEHTTLSPNATFQMSRLPSFSNEKLINLSTQIAARSTVSVRNMIPPSLTPESSHKRYVYDAHSSESTRSLAAAGTSISELAVAESPRPSPRPAGLANLIVADRNYNLLTLPFADIQVSAQVPEFAAIDQYVVNTTKYTGLASDAISLTSQIDHSSAGWVVRERTETGAIDYGFSLVIWQSEKTLDDAAVQVGLDRKILYQVVEELMHTDTSFNPSKMNIGEGIVGSVRVQPNGDTKIKVKYVADALVPINDIIEAVRKDEGANDVL